MDLAWEILWDLHLEAGTTLVPSQRGLILLGVLGKDQPGTHPSRDTPCTERGQGTCTAPFSFPFRLPLSCSQGDFASPLPQPVEGGLGRAACCLRGVMSLGGTGWRKENLRHPVCLAELTEPCVWMLRNKTTPKGTSFPCWQLPPQQAGAQDPAGWEVLAI